jgi:hypothetical protein
VAATAPVSTGSSPFGVKPPCAVRLERCGVHPGQSPITKQVPSTKNTVMAATLIEANQNSNSP